MKKIIYTFFLCLLAAWASAQISQAEYFVDADPGEGNGTAIPVGFSNNVDADFDVNTFGIEPGVHLLYVRVKGFDGHWSLYFKHSFTISNVVEQPNTPMVAAEYFFDTDPGEGNGEPIAVTVGFNVTNDLSLDISALSQGVHQLFVRVRDFDGHWSLYRGGEFEIVVDTDGVEELATREWNLYPNPAKDYVVVPQNITYDYIQISDLQGKEIIQIHDKISQIDVSKLDEGCYFIHLIVEGKIISKKLMIN